MRTVLFKLTELVAAVMTKTKGAIVHDGWTKSGTNYFGFFASFIRSVLVMKNGVHCLIDELTMPLLTVSPLRKAVCDSNESDDEVERFDAKTHASRLEDVFEFYVCNVYEWVLCSIADNCNVSKKLAKLLNVPHVG